MKRISSTAKKSVRPTPTVPKWDGQTMMVKLNDLAAFLTTNNLKVLWSSWPMGDQATAYVSIEEKTNVKARA